MRAIEGVTPLDQESACGALADVAGPVVTLTLHWARPQWQFDALHSTGYPVMAAGFNTATPAKPNRRQRRLAASGKKAAR